MAKSEMFQHHGKEDILNIDSWDLKIRTNDENSIFHIYHTAKLFTSGAVEVETSLSRPDFAVDRSPEEGGFVLTDENGPAFYPGLEKEDCKRAVFRYLQERTGKEIPWGTLIGVRPTKLAARGLKLGQSDEEIRQSMKENYLVTDRKTALALTIAHKEEELLNTWKRGQVGIYIDMPFCPTKCFYCSFLSYPTSMKSLMERYHKALLKDIAATGEMIREAGLVPGYVYFGGGTPTAPQAAEFAQILQAVEQHLLPAGEDGQISEYTVEAGRPDTITEEKLRIMKEAGVTRISINPQTFNDHTLERMGRTHTGAEIKAAFEMARGLGFTEINMDFILGLPGETARDAAHSIRTACELGPENITIHGLAIKKGALLAQAGAVSMAEVPAMYDAAYDMLSAYGYEPYYLYRNKNTLANLENVGFTKPGHANRYNIAMIEETDSIIACGASGITKIITNERDAKGNQIIRRHSGYKDLYLYLDRFDELMRSKRELIRQALGNEALTRES